MIKLRLDRYWIVGLLITTLCSISMRAIAFVPPTDQITIGLDANYAPLQSVDKDGLPHGYDIDFTRELMKRMGIKYYYVPNLWNKVATSVLNGDTDLAMMVYSSYRKDTIYYSRPIFRLYYQVVYRKSDYKTFDFRNLKGKTFAFLNSRHISELVEREGGTCVKVNDLDQSFRELANGRYDAIICYRYQAKYFIDHYNLEGLAREEISLQPREYCYVGHNKELIDAISLEIAKMDSEGLVDKIYGSEIKEGVSHHGVPMWIWYVSVIIILALISLYIFTLYRSRRKLQFTNAMLETNYNILEMSHMELEQTNHQLIEATARAEESSKMKTHFIQQISHEIRTPLNILSGFTQILTTPDLELGEDEKKQIANDIVTNTERITGLVNKMLELSDANSRNVIERTDKVSPNKIVSEAIVKSMIADSPSLTFDLEMQPEVEKIQLKTNMQAAVRALTLLLDNARKFSAKNADQRVKLHVEALPSSVQFAIEDNGIGVPAKEAEHIFDEFVQLDAYYEGTGIGLTVARSMARRMGGDIQLDTDFNPGARFVMTLPR
ncbi:amino acid-binding domain sensor histidine kinase [Xylanibacter ruminicola]|uniref:histidine kinase n=2 Tax=Xylanibacter ruminicola TaxID=839 RepID=A0A1M7KK57_XYLRU|nr:amino acid-binding domain sensor histidine kinase [Xylanibacter ruminicola]SHM65752.1 amino acid-binding domain sensor histidine kinase [Xylanibacter ruminicola]